MQSHPDQAPPPTLTAVRVEGLFGSLTHEIDNLASHPVSFLTGKNGVGKTTVLDMLSAVSSQNWSKLVRVQFTKLRLEFVNSEHVTELTICRHLERLWLADGELEIADLPSELPEDGSEPETPDRVTLLRPGIPDGASDNQAAEIIGASFDEVSRSSCGRHWDVAGAPKLQHIDDRRLVSNFRSKLIAPAQLPASIHQVLDSWMVVLIEANRLQIHVEDSEHSAVSEVEKGIERLGSEHLRRSAGTRIARSDKELMEFIFTGSDLPPSEEEVREQFDAFLRVNSMLSARGFRPLLDISLPPAEMTDDELRQLDTFLRARATQSELDHEFEEQLQAFEEMLNESLLRLRIAVHRDRLQVTHTETDQSLGPESLSSGEQHQLLLGFRTMFEAPEGSMVLIDEPELSMHLDWQVALPARLEKIGRLRSLTFLLATHSPSIVNDRFEAMTPLTFADG